jgi:dihydrodipicolinate synthase/N-acetylneuraminate lyase
MRAEAGILVACVLPWDEDGELDEPLFRRHVRAQARDVGPHLYVFGTAGEGYAVDDRRFVQVARAFIDEAPRAMLGIISLSLATVIERIELGRELGYREFQLSLPSWGALRDSEVDRFFAETCGRFEDCRFLHYNLARSGRVLRGRELGRLAARHENLVAVKFSSSDPAAVHELVTEARPLRAFLTEHAFALAGGRAAAGLLPSVLLACPARVHEYHAASPERLVELRAEVHAVERALDAAIGDPDVHMDGAYDKLLAKIRLPELPLRLLPPYQGAGADSFRAFRAALPARYLEATAGVAG